MEGIHGIKYLLMEFFHYDQIFLKRSLRNFNQFRNYICTEGQNCVAKALAVPFVLGNILAEKLNATLIAAGHPKYNNNGSFPKFLPGLQHLDITGRTFEKTWNAFYSKRTSANDIEMPEFFPAPVWDFNFVICELPKRKYQSIWELSMFLDPFGFWVWIGLAVTFLLVGLLAFSSFLNKRNSFSPAFLQALSVLLSPGGSGIRKNSILFVLWMETCLILDTFYSGKLTSEVIRPAPVETIENLVQLEKSNYRLIFSELVFYGAIKMAVASIHNTTVIPKDFVTLQTIVGSHETLLYGNLKFFAELIHEDKVASMALWPFAARQAIIGSHMISDEGNNLRKSTTKQCYVGKKLIHFGRVFYAFTPPGSAILIKVFRRLGAAGIVYRWSKEFEEMTHSSRVQNRGRVKSRTSVEAINSNVFEKLALEGKTVTIFLLWIGCISGSLVVFLFQQCQV